GLDADLPQVAGDGLADRLVVEVAAHRHVDDEVVVGRIVRLAQELPGPLGIVRVGLDGRIEAERLLGQDARPTLAVALHHAFDDGVDSHAIAHGLAPPLVGGGPHRAVQRAVHDLEAGDLAHLGLATGLDPRPQVRRDAA